MTVEAPPKPPRHSRALRIVLGCLAAAILVPLVLFGSCVYSSVRWANQRNAQNRAAAQPVLAAIEQYRKANGHYPETLCDASPPKSQFAEMTQVYYTATRAGDRFWFAYIYAEPHFAFPSDDVTQYDSASRDWSVMDMNDATARWDEKWAAGCTTAPPSTSK